MMHKLHFHIQWYSEMGTEDFLKGRAYDIFHHYLAFLFYLSLTTVAERGIDFLRNSIMFQATAVVKYLWVLWS